MGQCLGPAPHVPSDATWLWAGTNAAAAGDADGDGALDLIVGRCNSVGEGGCQTEAYVVRGPIDTLTGDFASVAWATLEVGEQDVDLFWLSDASGVAGAEVGVNVEGALSIWPISGPGTVEVPGRAPLLVDGTAMLRHDFDADGELDLAVSSGSRTVGDRLVAGQVWVLWGPLDLGAP